MGAPLEITSMSNSGWIVIGIAAVAAYLVFFGNPLGDVGSRDSNPTSGKASSGTQGTQQGLIQDLVGGIAAAITLGGQYLQNNPKTT
jgi:hypothetical protein